MRLKALTTNIPLKKNKEKDEMNWKRKSSARREPPNNVYDRNEPRKPAGQISFTAPNHRLEYTL